MTPGWFTSSTGFMKLFGMPLLLFNGRGNSASCMQTTEFKQSTSTHEFCRAAEIMCDITTPFIS